MKRIVCALATVLTLFLISAQAAYAGPPALPDLRASSFCVSSYYDADGKPRASGTAFSVSYQGKDIILSAAHVFADSDEWIELRSYYNSIHWARVVTLDRAKDVAVLEWATKPEWVLNLHLANASYPYRLYQRLDVFGCPMGKTLWWRGGNLIDTNIFSWTKDDRNLVLTSNIALISGDSGGPILAENGDVVGIAVAQSAEVYSEEYREFPPIPLLNIKGWFVPLSIIYQFLGSVAF